MHWWHYENLPRRAPYDWSPASKGARPWDQLDFHIDLGCGRVPKGRLGIDLRPSPGATDLAIDLNDLLPSPERENDTPAQRDIIEQTWGIYKGHVRRGLPFPDCSIKSIVTHHCLEHIGDGFERLMEECYRVLEWNGVMRIIVPLFPSFSSLTEYDHKRWIIEGYFDGFCQEPDGGPSCTDAFSERYNTACFRKLDEDMSPPTEPHLQWTREDAREVRVTLWKHEPGAPNPNPMDYWPETVDTSATLRGGRP